MDDKYLDAVAHTLYLQGVIIDRWDDEQSHVKYTYRGFAERFMEQLNGIGYTVTELPKPEPAPMKTQAPVVSQEEKEIVSAEPKVEKSPAKPVRGTRKAPERQADTSKENE